MAVTVMLGTKLASACGFGMAKYGRSQTRHFLCAKMGFNSNKLLLERLAVVGSWVE